MHNKGHLSITLNQFLILCLNFKSSSMCMGNRKGHMKTIKVVVII
jgi:hypothetical protein